MMTPISALFRQADNCPLETAFIAGEEVWSYLRFGSAVERLARALVSRGIEPGERVVLHMANRPELAIAYYACFRVGAIAVPLNARFKTAELRPLLTRLRPSLYLGEAALYPQVAPIEADILASHARFVLGAATAEGGAQTWENLFVGIDGLTLSRHPDETAPSVLLCTSGTTGIPKFVTHTPATLSVIADSYKTLRFAEKNHIAIHSAPMAHASGLMTLIAAIRYGVPVVLLERFDPDAVLDAIERHRGTWLVGLPFMFARIVRHQRMRPRRTGSLRFCLSGGDVCPLELQHDFPELFGVPLHSVWAMTETVGTLTYGLRPGPVSRIVPGSEIRLVDANGNQVPRGEAGELLVRGPNVTVGYWRAPGQIDDATEDGWLHTGDLMKWAGGDELWFVGRKKELIVRGGSNVSPVEVERVLRAHPAVRDVAVAGVFDRELG
jgi:acyl-CoA synthetase (AMP-forming)/AMP-acid ligase II